MVEPKEYDTPAIMVAFGATGDLMRIKILPALFYLFTQKQLPRHFRLIGFSRRDMDDAQFRLHVREQLINGNGEHISETAIIDFLEIVCFVQGDFQSKADYEILRARISEIERGWGGHANTLFYLSVAPEFYGAIFENLAVTHLIDRTASKDNWMRIIVEKPFGTDLQTALSLDEQLAAHFTEDQIYRIDHYLAKEMLQNILTFRFENNLFDFTMGNRLIERIDIRVLESIGVEKRGAFYDSIGALRDVGQNHFLQILSLLTMERPQDLSASSIQAGRANLLAQLQIIHPDNASQVTVRAQYDGYRSIPGVAADSQTETYFKIQAGLMISKWHGVPIVLEGGKRLGPNCKEAVVTLKHSSPCLCPPNKPHRKNTIIIRFDPKEEIVIHFWAKRPGLTFETEPRTLRFSLREQGEPVQYVEEYARLLLDVIRGDQLLFVSSAEVRAMWRFIDPILDAWQRDKVPLKTYATDARVPMEVLEDFQEASAQSSHVMQEIGIIGLGKMGGNIATRLLDAGWQVSGLDPHATSVEDLVKRGMTYVHSAKDLAKSIAPQRIIWLMVPAGETVDDVLFGSNGVVAHLQKGDVVIDGGNSHYMDSVERAKRLKRLGIHFVDVGFSGGPSGARDGASLMVGGSPEVQKDLEPLFLALAVNNGYRFFSGIGAGHFVKMVHNGIEYGMMQALAEGFEILKKSGYELDLTNVADIYNHGSVIESRLVGWLHDAFILHGENLKDVPSVVGHTGEGAWTIEAAKREGVRAKVIAEALAFRIQSAKEPSYAGKVLSSLREQFGGHRS